LSVWVRDSDVHVIGCEIASRYAQLATFPPQGSKDPHGRAAAFDLTDWMLSELSVSHDA